MFARRNGGKLKRGKKKTSEMVYTFQTKGVFSFKKVLTREGIKSRIRKIKQ